MPSCENYKELEQCTDIKRRMCIIDLTTGSNEAVHCEYFFTILYHCDKNYRIKKVTDVINEELIAIKKDLVAGFLQNVMQLESSYHTNTRKRKALEAFDEPLWNCEFYTM